jgi:hypothetical protein
MKTQTQVRISVGHLVASAMLLASATAFGGDVSAVSDGGRSASDDFGRSSAAPSSNGGILRSAGDVPGVQNVAGRGSQIGAKSARVTHNGTEVSHLGRSSGNIATAGRAGKSTQTAGLAD